MKKIITFSFAFILGNTYSQESINTSGGNDAGAGGSVNYSVGQIVTSSYIGSGGTLNEGVQQPFEVFILSNENFENFNNVVLYPNPTSSQLFLSCIETKEAFKYSFIDISGNILLQDEIEQINATINIESFPVGMYFLTISSINDSKSKSYKIIKK